MKTHGNKRNILPIILVTVAATAMAGGTSPTQEAALATQREPPVSLKPFGTIGKEVRPFQPGREAEAIKLAEQAYKLSPGNADIMDTYAGTLIQKNTPETYEKAEMILRRAIQQKLREGVDIPPGLYVHLGQALLGLGRHTEVEAQLVLAEESLNTGKFLEDVESLKAKIRDIRAKLNEVR